MLDFNDVALFTHIVKAGSFAAAGRRLGIPANTLSRRMAHLEEAVQTRLLTRTTRKLNLTTAGEVFFRRCMDGVSDIEQAGESLREATTEPAGTLRVTAPVDFFDHLPLAWIAEFMRLHPKVEVEMLLDDKRIDLVEERIDVAFRAGALDGADWVARKLAGNPRCLFASAAYLQDHGTPQSVAELAQLQCLTAGGASSGGAGKTVWQLLGPQGMVEVSVSGRFRANTAQVQAHAAHAGLGIALLPLALARGAARNSSLVQVLPEYRNEVGGLYAVSPSRRHRAPAVKALVEFVAQKLRASPLGSNHADKAALVQGGALLQSARA